MNPTELLLKALSQTESWVQNTIVFGLFGLVLFQAIWGIWRRHKVQQIIREKDQLEIRFEHSQERLKDEEKELQRKEQQLKEVQSQATRDREQLRRAIPAFDRVVRQNEELLRLRRESSAYQENAEAQTIERDEAIRERDALLETVESVRRSELRLQTELADLRRRSEDLLGVDTNIWIASRATTGDLPRFVHREQRKTRFVTILNLKGGVGKTTLTANLAAAYATGVLEKKLRVLAVDLDYQGTLSSMCVKTDDLQDRRLTRRTADRLLDAASIGRGMELLNDLLTPMNGTEKMAKVIIADDNLDHADFRQQAIYCVNQAEVRFFHRQFFHQPIITDKFDLVIFDCPPRLTTSSMNALAASDWIVVPTALDPNDVEAVPRSLRLLANLQQESQIDFHVNLAGVILNSTYRGGAIESLTNDEREGLQQLRTGISHFDRIDSPILVHTIKDDSRIPRAAANKIPFGSTSEGRDLYKGVAEELYKRIIV